MYGTISNGYLLAGLAGLGYLTDGEYGAASSKCARFYERWKYWRKIKWKSGILTKTRRDADKQLDNYRAKYKACEKTERFKTKATKKEAKAEAKAAKGLTTEAGFQPSEGGGGGTPVDEPMLPAELPMEGGLLSNPLAIGGIAAAVLLVAYLATRTKGGGGERESKQQSRAAPAASYGGHERRATSHRYGP